MALHLESFSSNPNANYFMLLSFFISTLLLALKITTKRQRNLPPSPPKLPIIGNYHQLGTLPHRSFLWLSQKYGPLLMLKLGQLPVLLVSSAELAKEVMQTHDIAFAGRPQLTAARILLYGCKDIAYSSYGEVWRQKKKICVTELLTLKKVQAVQVIQEEEVEVLVEKIRNACRSNGGFVNLRELLSATVIDVVFRCVFGRKYDGSCRFGDILRKVMVHIPDFNLGDMFPVLGWVGEMTGQNRKYWATLREMDGFFDEAISQRKMGRMDKDKKCFLDALLQLQDTDHLQFQLTNDDIKAVILDMFLGGTDTTSTTLEWAMAELIRNPSIMKKVQKEVREVVGKKPRVEWDDINQMDYLKCVIKETLRLHHPAPLLDPRETTSDVKLAGYDIPNKTMVYVNAWALQMDPEVWEKPEEFLPERFENFEIALDGQNFNFIPFGSGRRKCPGIAFGLASLEYILANILFWFDWKLYRSDETGQDLDLDMSEVNGVTVNMKVPLHLEPIPYSVTNTNHKKAKEESVKYNC